jgi:hypothetical protein
MCHTGQITAHNRQGRGSAVAMGGGMIRRWGDSMVTQCGVRGGGAAVGSITCRVPRSDCSGYEAQVVPVRSCLTCCASAKPSETSPRAGGWPMHNRAAVGCQDKCSQPWPRGVRSRSDSVNLSGWTTCEAVYTEHTGVHQFDPVSRTGTPMYRMYRMHTRDQRQL